MSACWRQPSSAVRSNEPVMNDFDDNFGGPADGSFHDPYDLTLIDPIYLVALVVVALLIVALCLLGFYIGRQRGRARLDAERKVSREAIHDHVRYALDRALKSSGGVILERGREVADILDSRVGLLIALNGKLGKIVKGLEDALKAEKPADHVPPAAPKVTVARATEDHFYRVYKELQALNQFWKKAEILDLLEKAQMELSTPPARPAVSYSFFKFGKGAVTPVGQTAAAVFAPTPVVVDIPPQPAADAPPPVKAQEAAPAPEPTPPPPPPAPPPLPRNKKLPAHKRNMLA